MNGTPSSPIRWSPEQISFAVIATVIVMAASLHLATPLLTVLFSSFIINKLNVGGRKWLAIALFSAVVLLVFYAFTSFVRHAGPALQEAAEEAIPKIITYASEKGIELPFHDLSGLKSMASEEISEWVRYLANFAKLATKEFAYLVIGMVAAASLFLNSTLDVDPERHPVRENLYSACCRHVARRFQAFYYSFETVMGAQIIISAINTVLTGVFLFTTPMKFRIVLMGVTFLCGLLPIIGNILSNCVIVGVAFTISPTMAIAALAFLVILHKLEYFLNSKIIGDRISNPVWLTLLGLVAGERLMGIPGMILAPVLLYYVKVEAGRMHSGETPAEASDRPLAQRTERT
jgi:predicted PurR-regulated permease PerM